MKVADDTFRGTVNVLSYRPRAGEKQMYAGSSECDLLWAGVISHVVLVSDLVRTSNGRGCGGGGVGGGWGGKLPGLYDYYLCYYYSFFSHNQ